VNADKHNSCCGGTRGRVMHSRLCITLHFCHIKCHLPRVQKFDTTDLLLLLLLLSSIETRDVFWTSNNAGSRDHHALFMSASVLLSLKQSVREYCILYSFLTACARTSPFLPLKTTCQDLLKIKSEKIVLKRRGLGYFFRS